MAATAARTGIFGIIPGTRADHHHARHQLGRNDSAAKTGAPAIPDLDDIAVGDAARGGILRTDFNRLAALHLGGFRPSAGIKLRMQLVGGLLAEEMQREFRIGTARPFIRYIPRCMGGAIRLAEPGNHFGV